MEADESNKEVSCGGISLRRLTVLDIDAFMVWASDSEVARFCTWEPIQSKEEGIEFISKSVVPHPWFRAICVEDDVAVGAMMVMENKNWGDRCRVELGFHLGSKYWGRGIMTEAVKMGVVEVFKELKEVERVEAFAEVDNVGSQRVLEKAGFTREAGRVCSGSTLDSRQGLGTLSCSVYCPLTHHHLHIPPHTLPNI